MLSVDVVDDDAVVSVLEPVVLVSVLDELLGTVLVWALVAEAEVMIPVVLDGTGFSEPEDEAGMSVVLSEQDVVVEALFSGVVKAELELTVDETGEPSELEAEVAVKSTSEVDELTVGSTDVEPPRRVVTSTTGVVIVASMARELAEGVTVKLDDKLSGRVVAEITGVVVTASATEVGAVMVASVVVEMSVVTEAVEEVTESVSVVALVMVVVELSSMYPRESVMKEAVEVVPEAAPVSSVVTYVNEVTSEYSVMLVVADGKPESPGLVVDTPGTPVVVESTT